MSEDEEEDGQISRFEEQEEKEKRLLNKVAPDDEPVSLEDVNKCRLSRDQLAKSCIMPWFEDFVKGLSTLLYILLSIFIVYRSLRALPYWPGIRGPRLPNM